MNSGKENSKTSTALPQVLRMCELSKGFAPEKRSAQGRNRSGKENFRKRFPFQNLPYILFYEKRKKTYVRVRFHPFKNFDFLPVFLTGIRRNLSFSILSLQNSGTPSFERNFLSSHVISRYFPPVFLTIPHPTFFTNPLS